MLNVFNYRRNYLIKQKTDFLYEMAAFSFNNLLNEIEGLDEDGIAIVDKLYNWNTAEDGK